MTTVYIEYDEDCDYYRDDGDGDWDHSWSKDYSYSNWRVSLQKGKSWADEHKFVGEEPKPGDNIGLVKIRYSDGDSFGNASGMQHVLWVGTVEQAMEVAKQVNEMFTAEEDWGRRRLRDGHNFEATQVTLPGHDRPTYMGTYDDYFGGFDDCWVEVLPLNP